MAELLLGQPLFPGESGVDQHVEIIKVLGTPTREEIKCMNPNYTKFKFPQIKPYPWHKGARAALNMSGSMLSVAETCFMNHVIAEHNYRVLADNMFEDQNAQITKPKR